MVREGSERGPRGVWEGFEKGPRGPRQSRKGLVGVVYGPTAAVATQHAEIVRKTMT